ncbi:MAG TPA: heavy-metal-associated domain-containing protein [Trueperaceae bacterium]|nr:heavy-metal-associated domain-containing protein [Trueperaceae bacterium]
MTDPETARAGDAGSEFDEASENLATALVAVRGMESDEAKRRVHAALAAVAGVHGVRPGDGGKMVVDYDPSEATAMDLIRSLRRIGFLAGMD